MADPVPWPEVERPRRAGVSSFGASGTNAHVIVEYVPESAESAESAGSADEVEADGVPDGDGSVVPWVLSARNPQALCDQARRLSDAVMAAPTAAVQEVGWSLLHSRSLFERRAVVVGRERGELLAGLAALAAGEVHPALTVSREDAALPSGDTVWLFSGQGSQLVGMGAGLYGRFPVFAAAFDEVCGLL
ncbi:ketoacyl-synthetase C-terminal extension domain-containing protein, partial [Streptomyces aurantiacus]|uniref:ketoacyl-synthetase C-terminal extension domain-containing protein n=1 Tax=Streptomyces aurantiacus TaxID=47760 RepID=UPI0035E81469